ncbi:Conserved hypothetical protein; putative membrane protein; putative acyltransferase [Bradyrhizobium sp. ORS 278]|uniref:acyltransferase family protein n=1 Tax=Bradyrhizobium sp. (strain ORS 278) TaxID=114615 RepID=UPI00015083D9|nr:acyltransferase [Bradyrhizobium sp. ORS 278]CAL80001.1 Conserved hypothetical protein; putative membrane protein; putative acyltransferase [Bradyrhizobium sp. ORS 278]
MHESLREKSRLRAVTPFSQVIIGERTAYLDSIRAFAAIQVLLLHFASGFLPDLVAPSPASRLAAAIHGSPLSFLYDGTSAVYIFFCLSGYVLTRSFQRDPCSMPRQMAARAVRLGLPALAATVFAASVILLFGKANVQAGLLTDNAWLSKQWNIDVSMLSLLKDGVFNALFLGYRDVPGIGLLAPWQNRLNESFVAPFWTLSTEFYGSVMILVLCRCARQAPRIWLAIAILGTLYTIRSAYICFFVGHLLASVRYADRPASQRRPIATIFILTGLFLCVIAEVWQPAWLIRLCSLDTVWLFPGQFPPMQHKAFGAILILIGIMDHQACRDFLGHPRLVGLSKFSFPLYLVHWPVLCGLSSTAFVALSEIWSTESARIPAILLGLAASAAVSYAFRPVDRCAIWLSSRIRISRLQQQLSLPISEARA